MECIRESVHTLITRQSSTFAWPVVPNCIGNHFRLLSAIFWLLSAFSDCSDRRFHLLLTFSDCSAPFSDCYGSRFWLLSNLFWLPSNFLRLLSNFFRLLSTSFWLLNSFSLLLQQTFRLLNLTTWCLSSQVTLYFLLLSLPSSLLHSSPWWVTVIDVQHQYLIMA